ncbi:MAG: glycosyl transferase, group 1 [uncultured bacterium]|uniref:Glycosyl transferase, group 1 n=4 Tax=Candidatus Daviesiibacteriota TaxID=1752718 RepID=A0A0G0EQK4_9BACT|nr:MAG: glycosyl transferase, group 1 [uncultured bacterium]KKQ07797.1 MAG: Glycosyl transferase, group 1 [Candidatus Daviesbacteria bacterium GW2011_GWB1_36_5]KKQ15444.1 MAG: Glycosyl transferase, group 1 [Candidatus Daviesbacteria bacterium GW2011_GWA1_36_8]OGE17462.1 MAG: hypothetical protein A2858_00960 [Candidatus Daviesbacteria bacterium RIFCSPHIGHO2_01_FULL_36_37]OGE36557.1 MAG: hypothetical protein A3E66_02805 [Candidatus Daviesbacteria bacterium RIFCSPHIGHO2_12_FULL_37_16]
MEKKKRIVFLSRYVGVVDRGVETYVLELSKRLKHDFDVEIFSNETSDDIRKVIKGKFDVVIPTNGRVQSLKVLFGKLFSKYKVIIPGQAGVGRDDLWNILITVPDVYVALTDYEKDWAKKWAWKTIVVKIPNGVDLRRFKPGEKIDFGLEKPVVLSVGALDWYKYHELAIKAVSRMRKGSLLIVGRGQLKKQLEDLGKRMLGNRFKIAEFDFNDMSKVYKSGDVFTLPSWIRESFGIVYVEAMACGLAVVAPDDLPRREIIGKAGILTDVFDEEKYAKALEDALNRDWGQIPVKQAEKFSWDLIALEYKKLINSLLE